MFFAEGGGGRPGDTDAPGVTGLDTVAFHLWGRLSGLVPRIGIAAGRCFAGNAAILGSSDVVIATRDANIGMGGLAIEGGGLGVYAPETSARRQSANGVVDVVVDRPNGGGHRGTVVLAGRSPARLVVRRPGILLTVPETGAGPTTRAVVRRWRTRTRCWSCGRVRSGW